MRTEQHWQHPQRPHSLTAPETCPETPEFLKAQLRKRPRFILRSSIDTSSLRSDGTLLRSHRLARLEAALMITRSASAGKLARLARLVNGAEVRQLISLLNESYDRTRSAFRIEQTATGYQLLTRPSLAGWLDRLHQRQERLKLSQPAQETLTIIAYQQPVTRADVESIRGVQSTDLIRQLIDRGLIRVAGEDDSLGRPFLYATTRAFLDMFGLGRLQDLPDYESLCRKTETPDADDSPEASDEDEDFEDDDEDEDDFEDEEDDEEDEDVDDFEEDELDEDDELISEESASDPEDSSAAA